MARGDARDTRWVDVLLEGPALPKRAALVVGNPGGTLHPAQAEAVRTAGKHLAAAGYEVEEVSPPGAAAGRVADDGQPGAGA